MANTETLCSYLTGMNPLRYKAGDVMADGSRILEIRKDQILMATPDGIPYPVRHSPYSVLRRFILGTGADTYRFGNRATITFGDVSRDTVFSMDGREHMISADSLDEVAEYVICYEAGQTDAFDGLLARIRKGDLHDTSLPKRHSARSITESSARPYKKGDLLEDGSRVLEVRPEQLIVMDTDGNVKPLGNRPRRDRPHSGPCAEHGGSP